MFSEVIIADIRNQIEESFRCMSVSGAETLSL